MRTRRKLLAAAMAIAAVLTTTVGTATADPRRGGRPTHATAAQPTTAERLVAYAETFDDVLTLPGAGKLVLDTEAATLRLSWDGSVPARAAALLAAAPAGVTASAVSADYSMSELGAAIDRAAAAAAAQDVLVSVAQPTPDLSGIVLTVVADSFAARATARRQVTRVLQRRAGVPLRIRTVRQGPAPLSRADDSAPWQGGARMVVDGVRCTTGFAVRKDGYGYLLSAGHCDWNANAPVYDGGGDLIAGSAAAAVKIKQGLDSLLIDPVSGTIGEMYRGGINAPATNEDDVTGSAAPASGAPVCISGAASGEHCNNMVIGQTGIQFDCDPAALRVLLCPGFVVVNTVEGVAASEGDSGAGVYIVKADGTLGARGIISTGIAPRSCGGAVWGPAECFSRFYAVDIKDLEAAWGVKVETE